MIDSPHPNAVSLSSDWYGADTPDRGRGLFAARPFAAGEVIGRYAALPLSAREVQAIRGTRAYDYVFWVREAPEHGPEAFDAALALGAISLCNHSRRASASFEVSPDGLYIVQTAARAIPAHGEITIDYGDFVHFEERDG